LICFTHFTRLIFIKKGRSRRKDEAEGRKEGRKKPKEGREEGRKGPKGLKMNHKWPGMARVVV
jgi:hypothetical protein